MAKTLNPTPEPVVVQVICSLCDQAWDKHGDAPTTLDCIRLLKAKVVYVRSPFPTYPYWSISTSDTKYAHTINGANTNAVVFRTPQQA